MATEVCSYILDEDRRKNAQLIEDAFYKKLESFDLKHFNKNIVDPVKLIFDKTVYQSSWNEIVSNEIFRVLGSARLGFA